MNDDFSKGLLAGLLVGAILSTATFIVTWGFDSKPHHEIIKHGAAYYHPETGEFTWKDEEIAK